MLRRALQLRGYATATRPVFSEAGGSSSSGPSLDVSSSSTETNVEPAGESSPSHLDKTDAASPSASTSAWEDNFNSRQSSIDKLWDRVLQTPAAVANPSHKYTPRQHPLSQATPSPRPFKGTTSNRRRAEGQTPHEARSLNDALQRTFNHLEATAFRSGAARSRSFESLLLPPASFSRGPRVENNEPELVIAVDALAEELSLLTSSSEIVAWAQDKVFAKETGENTRSQFPKTYPRALAALIRTLWVRINAPHLALAMFEHAKALGVESYLAGCQTSAYNELVRVRWEAFKDLGGVLQAVREMQQHAVAWDRGTRDLVGHIVDSVGRDILDSNGRWGREAYDELAMLESMVQNDTAKEEARWDRKRQFKHAYRREAYRERESRGRNFPQAWA